MSRQTGNGAAEAAISPFAQANSGPFRHGAVNDVVRLQQRQPASEAPLSFRCYRDKAADFFTIMV